MRNHFIRNAACAALGAAVYAGPTLLAVTEAHAAQAWYCICQGEKKRFLASSRHCEYVMNVPRGQSCTRNQTRKVYAPACVKQGCKIAPFN